jgi:xanthine dehydrogenase small subunit
MSAPATLHINGNCVDVSGVPLHESLLDFLRHSGRTGTKSGCNEGDCGACTVLLLENNGPPRAINACLALVHSLVGRAVLTAEGLASAEGALHPVQQAMAAGGGSQCGYCTPGFVCSLAEAAARNVTGDPAAVADQLCGNLCRCTGYRPIREAAASLGEVAAFPSAPAPLSCSGTHDYLTPACLAEALEMKSRHPHAAFIAGATELAVLINKRHLRPERLISLEHVRELHEVNQSENSWSIGAAVPLTDLESILKGEFPAIDDMLRLFASRQIRHRATLGGNLVTASPIGDSAPVLLALDASLTLVSTNGSRSIALTDFFTGYRSTVMQPGEILSTIHIPRNPSGVCRFFKVSKRREMDISTVSAAIRIAADDNGIITTARLAFGGVAASPARATQTELALVGMPLANASAPHILDLLASEFTPLSDLRGSSAYRSLLIRELYQKYLLDASETSFPAPHLQTSETSSSSLVHESARGHVTGEALYTQDIALRRDALHVWLVRSTDAHANLLELDCSEAAKAPGVRAVLTAADIPGHNNTGPSRHDEPLFATDRIQFHGQLLAAVIAESPEQARLAGGLVKVKTQTLTPVLGIEEAIEKSSFHTEPRFLVRGEIEDGMADAPHIIEGTFRIGGQEQFYLETQAALAEIDGEGGIHIHSSTQHPSETQTIVAEVLGWAKHRVVVECPRMGGGFGGKETQANPWAAICALGALKTGRPVSIQLDRDHDIESTGKRHPFMARYKVGYHPDGRLHAADIELYSDGGWSLDLSQPVNDRALFHLDNAYYIPHVRFRGQVCKTNVTSHTAFRGFGGPQGMLVIEEIIGRISESLDLTAEEIRSRNFYHGEGESNTTHYGEVVEDNRLARIWSELMEMSCFQQRRGEIAAWNRTRPYRKRGLAITPGEVRHQLHAQTL